VQTASVRVSPRSTGAVSPFWVLTQRLTIRARVWPSFVFSCPRPSGDAPRQPCNFPFPGDGATLALRGYYRASSAIVNTDRESAKGGGEWHTHWPTRSGRRCCAASEGPRGQRKPPGPTGCRTRTPGALPVRRLRHYGGRWVSPRNNRSRPAVGRARNRRSSPVFRADTIGEKVTAVRPVAVVVLRRAGRVTFNHLGPGRGCRSRKGSSQIQRGPRRLYPS
jgi:hypothetical protein